jgi:hypothetical protein
MARAQQRSARQQTAYSRPSRGFAKKISDHIAMALVVYTLLLIFGVTPSLAHGMRIWPYFLLVVLVAGVIPFFRRLDHRWTALDASELSDSGLATRFAIDRLKLWLVAIGVPLLLAGVCWTVAAGA